MKKVLLILIFILIFFGAGAFAAHRTGFLDLNPILSQIPVLSGYIVDNPEALDESENMLVSPIEKENENLRKEKRDLEFKLTALEADKTNLLEQVTKLQSELTQVRAELSEQKKVVLNAEELAAFYQEMKPEAVVRIMENLDDDIVITILPLLDKKQSAGIIALMDPLRAAIITQLLLDKEIRQ